MDSFNKITIGRRDRFRRLNAEQGATLTCNCEQRFTIIKEWGDDIGSLQLDLGKIYAGSPLHTNMSCCFDQYKIHDVKLEFRDRGSRTGNRAAELMHPIFFSVIDRSGKMDQLTTLNILRTYSNYMETVMPNNTSIHPIQRRFFTYKSAGYCDTKNACKLPKCIIGCYDPTGLYMNFEKIIGVHMTCTVEYKGVRKDMDPVMGIFYSARNNINNMDF